MAKNITLSVEESKLNLLKKLAQSQGKSVNALMREAIDQLLAIEQGTSPAEAYIKFVRENPVKPSPSASDKWTREELYDEILS